MFTLLNYINIADYIAKYRILNYDYIFFTKPNFVFIVFNYLF